MLNINLPADGCVLNFLSTGYDMLPLHALPLGFWLKVVNPGFITCDDPLQKVVTFFAITSQMSKRMRLCLSISSLGTHLTHYGTEGYHALQNRQTQC
jgi:hypothetical protein